MEKDHFLGLLKHKDALKKLEEWQVFTLHNEHAVLGLFLQGLEHGNPDTGYPFSHPMKAFFQALRMAGFHHNNLRKAYERFRRQRSGKDSTDPAASCGTNKT